MKKWEYDSIRLGISFEFAGKGGQDEENTVLYEATEKAKDGWELVAVIPSEQFLGGGNGRNLVTRQVIAIFKREIPEGDPLYIVEAARHDVTTHEISRFSSANDALALDKFVEEFLNNPRYDWDWLRLTRVGQRGIIASRNPDDKPIGDTGGL